MIEQKISLISFKNVKINLLRITESSPDSSRAAAKCLTSTLASVTAELGYANKLSQSHSLVKGAQISTRPSPNIDFALETKLSCEISKRLLFIWAELLNPSYLFLITFRPIFVVACCVCVSLCSNKTLVCSIQNIWSLFEAFYIYFMQKTARVEVLPQIFYIHAPGLARGWPLFCRENKRNFKTVVDEIYEAEFPLRKSSLLRSAFLFSLAWLINITDSYSFELPIVFFLESANKKARSNPLPTTLKSKYFGFVYYFLISVNVVFGSRPSSFCSVCSAILAWVLFSSQPSSLWFNVHYSCWKDFTLTTPFHLVISHSAECCTLKVQEHI